MGAKPAGCALVGRAEDDQQKEHGHDDFGDQRRQQGVTPRRNARRSRSTQRPLVTSNPSAPLAMTYNTPPRDQSAEHLGHDVRGEFAGRETAAGPEADRDRRVQVAAGNMADGIRHRQDGQAEGKGYAMQADANMWKRSREARRCRNHQAQARTFQETPHRTVSIAPPVWMNECGIHNARGAQPCRQ